MELFEAICTRDLEGIVAKLAAGKCTPEETSWVKIKSLAYSQAEGRIDFFEGRAFKAAVLPELLRPALRFLHDALG